MPLLLNFYLFFSIQPIFLTSRGSIRNTSLPPQGRGKVRVHITLPRPHWMGITGYVVGVVVLNKVVRQLYFKLCFRCATPSYVLFLPFHICHIMLKMVVPRKLKHPNYLWDWASSPTNEALAIFFQRLLYYPKNERNMFHSSHVNSQCS